MSGPPTFDYVIVGAGSAGCVLANRLSADGRYTVLVLEAGGGDDHWLIKIPAGVARIWNAARFNWGYVSEPEPFLNGRRLAHPRGKLLGGSSSINMGAYVRGNRGDFDRWGQMGLDDWCYEKVLPYFKKSENYLSGRSEFRGRDGPMKTALTPVMDPVFEAYVEAGKALGYGHCADYNGKDQEGLARGQFTVADGRRQSAAVAFLQPALSRPNLTVKTRAHVQRILFQGKVATGVEYLQDGRMLSVRAAKEVIVSAGTYNSPQILMLSGIGPTDHLSEKGIAVIADRPAVGANLQDHPSLMVEYTRKTHSEFLKNLRLDRLVINMLRAALLRSGPASRPLGFATGFVRSGDAVGHPDIQIFLRLFSMEAKPWFRPFRDPAPAAIGLMACHLRPQSRGRVELSSSDAMAPPRILNNFFATESDRKSIRRAFKILRSIATHPCMGEHLGLERIPGPSIQSDEEIDSYVKDTSATVFHPAGTCRMGRDDESVVDPQLKVRGCANLRIVDASVMPDLVSGNINAAVTMIAEKGADYISGDR